MTADADADSMSVIVVFLLTRVADAFFTIENQFRPTTEHTYRKTGDCIVSCGAKTSVCSFSFCPCRCRCRRRRHFEGASTITACLLKRTFSAHVSGVLKITTTEQTSSALQPMQTTSQKPIANPQFSHRIAPSEWTLANP